MRDIAVREAARLHRFIRNRIKRCSSVSSNELVLLLALSSCTARSLLLMCIKYIYCTNTMWWWCLNWRFRLVDEPTIRNEHCLRRLRRFEYRSVLQVGRESVRG
jgi:hypothetical protein